MKFEPNGYSLDSDLYESLLLRLYGFEEYFYYKNDKHYHDYLYVIRQLDKIKNNKPISLCFKNAILGWYISFRNLKRYMSSSANGISITDSCQLKCKHCYNQNIPRENKFMSFDEFKEIFYLHNEYVKSFVHYNGDSIQEYHIEGGEATLNKDLYKMLSFLFMKNVKIALLTNGIQIPNENILKFFKNPTKNVIQISIDGLEESHDYIRGDGTFKKSMNTIKYLYDNNIRFNINFVYNSKNYKDVYELESYLKPYNCFQKGIMRYIDVQNGFIRDLNSEEMKFSEYYSYFNERPCNVGVQNCISTGGDYNSCDKMNHYPIANFFNDTKEDFLFKVKTFTIRSRSVPVYCFDCQNVNSCLGGHMCSSFNKFNMFNIEDTKCHMLNKKIKTDIPYEILEHY
jgi:MoaA/NifB/PqqE/SkfB family radical SAM enzyme